MPPVSKAQARFLFSQKPDIAARWKAEGAMEGIGKLPERVAKGLPGDGSRGKDLLHPAIAKRSMYVNATPTNESNHPAITKMPRIPGNRRDFGMLKPSASSRFVPKNKPYPNQQESDKESPVSGHGDSYETGHRLFKHEIKHPPNHTLNVRRAHKRLGF